MNMFKTQYLGVPTLHLEMFLVTSATVIEWVSQKKRFFAGRIAKVFKKQVGD